MAGLCRRCIRVPPWTPDTRGRLITDGVPELVGGWCWFFFQRLLGRGGVDPPNDNTSTPPGVGWFSWAARVGGAGFAEEGCCGFAEGFEGAEVEGRLGGVGGSGGGEVGALTPALSQQTERGRKRETGWKPVPLGLGGKIRSRVFWRRGIRSLRSSRGRGRGFR